MIAQRIFARGFTPSRCSPDVVAVEEELTAQNQQPDPEREAQWAPRNALAHQGSANRPGRAADDELQ